MADGDNLAPASRTTGNWLTARPLWQTGLIGLGGLAGLAGLVWLLARYWPGGVDYYFYFYPISHKWLGGRTQLFDQESIGYFHPPWTLWMTLLFTLWPYEIGRALLWLASVAFIIGGVIVFSRPGWGRPLALAAALFNLHTFDLLYRGQIDAFNVLGVTLGWLALGRRDPWLMGLAYIALMMKPPNGLAAGAWLLMLSILYWQRRKLGISLSLPFTLALATLVVFPGWPLRWPDALRQSPPVPIWETSIWHILDLFDLPAVIGWVICGLALAVTFWAWRRLDLVPEWERNLARLMLVVAVTFVVTPYTLSYHYVLLIGVVIPYLSRYRLAAVITLYMLTFLPVLRAFIGATNAWIDYFFVLAVFAAVIKVVLDLSAARRARTLQAPV